MSLPVICHWLHNICSKMSVHIVEHIMNHQTVSKCPAHILCGFGEIIFHALLYSIGEQYQLSVLLGEGVEHLTDKKKGLRIYLMNAFIL